MNTDTLPLDCDAYLLDFDELLLESIPRHQRAWNRMMERARLQIPLDAELLRSLADTPASSVAETIARTHDTWIDLEHFLYEEEILFAALRADAELARDLRELIPQLAARSRVALVSDGRREQIAPALALVGLTEACRLMIMRDDVFHGKPRPDVLLLAAGILRTPPARCVVLHDSTAAAVPILAAGMKPYRVSPAASVEAAQPVRDSRQGMRSQEVQTSAESPYRPKNRVLIQNSQSS